MKSFITVVAATVLAGCASKSLVLPSAAHLANKEAAILKIDRSKDTFTSRSELTNVYDLNKKNFLLSEWNTTEYEEIKVAPGDYKVGMKYYFGTGHSRPSASVRVQAGMTYLFTTSPVMNGTAARAEYRVVPTESETTPKK